MFGDRIALYETLTGRVVKWPNVFSLSWSQTLNDEEGHVEIGTTRDELNATETVPWKYSLALINVDDRVLAAGPIYKRTVNFDTGEVTVTAGSFWSLLKKTVWQAAGQPVISHGESKKRQTGEQVTTYNQTYKSTLYGIAFGVVRSQLRGVLPGVDDTRFPYPEGAHVRTYDGRELRTVAEIVGDVFGVQNPPIIRWEARFSPGDSTVYWHPQALSAEGVAGNATPSTKYLMLTTDKDVVTSWQATEDAGGLVNDCFAVSKQQESGNESKNSEALYSRHVAIPAGMPRLQGADKSHDNVKSADTLYEYAKGGATAQAFFDVSLRVSRGTSSAYGWHENGTTMRAGDWCELWANEPFYGPSTFGGRIEKIEGGLDDITISIQRLYRLDGECMDASRMISLGQTRQGDGTTRLMETSRFMQAANNPTT